MVGAVELHGVRLARSSHSAVPEHAEGCDVIVLEDDRNFQIQFQQMRFIKK